MTISDSKLEFVASMTIHPSEIRDIRKLIAISQTKVNPLRNVLITPLFANSKSLHLVRELVDEGTQVFFDSGGYYVQIGRMKYEELYLPLLRIYETHRWASVYTLPDHVPTSQDSLEDVAHKVRNTISFSSLFFHELPSDLKPRAMPVVQGHTIRHVDACLNAYLKLGVKHIGFGSFGTGGKNNETNFVSANSLNLVKYITDVAHQNDIKVHVFGLGRPALVAMIRGVNADSFDSSSWLKAAGFGQVFLPFMRGYNITYKSTVSELELGITYEQFREWVSLTQHECKLCDSIEDLQTHRMYRAVHNLIAVAETVDMINRREYDRIEQIYGGGSIKYRGEFLKWLSH